ncbi:MAG: elongation factor G [Luteitalea sp.]|nr:elongation factor G [Luteitalea sp.]
MKVFDAPSIRNIALVGHGGAGKTQLAAAMLFDAGTVNRLGKVDEGTTSTDYDEEEIARQHTLSATPAWLEWQKTKVNLIDTPGFANFLSDAAVALRIVEAAVVVVDAVSGVEVQTEKVWTLAAEAGQPRVIVLNRFDRERASLERSLGSLRDIFGRIIVPVTLPLGEEKGFRGVVNLLTMKALTYETSGSGTFTEGEIPAELVATAKEAREALVEMVAEADDALMERFFEEGALTDEELVSGLRASVRSSKLVPLFTTSALLNIGIHPLLDALVSLVPSPSDRPVPAVDRASGTTMQATAEADAPCRIFVWKTVADPFAGRITLFRVITGTLNADTTLHNLTRDTHERFGHLLVPQGKQSTQVPELRAGDVGAVAKLKETQTGDTLADKSADLTFPPFTWPEPLLSYAVEPKSRADEEKISSALHRLQEEDPTIRSARDAQTKELLISGQGQLHIEVTVAKLKRRFGVDVNLKLPRIPYLETITAATEAHGRHKKQTGGHGQFGDCKIRVQPLARGEDFAFVNDIFGGSIPRQFIPAVEKGIQDARLKGYLAGYPMVDFQVTLLDGQYHQVDSNELSFKVAGALAFKDAMARARPTLLEPVMNVEVYAPSEYAGDLMGDINSRRGRISGMEARGTTTVIRAQVPMAEMLTYEQTLTSLTGARGSYAMVFSHHEEVPTHLQQKIIATAKAERGEVVEEEV